jgi:hypothetical protein
MQVVRVVLRLFLAAVTCMWLWRQYSLISLSMKLHAPEPAEGLILEHTSKACNGKAELLKILKDAGMKNTSSSDVCRKLPRWKEVTRFYGEEPIVHGLDTCERYRALLSAEANNGTAVEPMVRVAGLFNTGTNAFCHLLNYNVKNLGNHEDWEVPWQKVRYEYAALFCFCCFFSLNLAFLFNVCYSTLQPNSEWKRLISTATNPKPTFSLWCLFENHSGGCKVWYVVVVVSTRSIL